MKGLNFTNLALLGGLAAVAIPILIHLLFRRPPRQMRFSTIQFFLARREESARRQKIRHWLLLLTRCLLLGLLVLAFARPFLRQESTATTRPPRDVVLVLDRSASMRAGDRWGTALAKATRILRDLSPEDRVAVIEAGVPARALSPLGPTPKALAVLQELAPGFGSGDLAQGLAEAVRVLKQTGAKREATIVVISDFQRRSAGNAKEIKVPEHFELRLDRVGALATPNVALSGLSLEPGRGVRLEVSRFGDGAGGAVNTELLVDGQSCTNCRLAIADSASQVLGLPTLNPGWHTVEARLTADAGGQTDKLDGLAADNRRWLALDVPKPLSVVVAEPRPSEREFEEESFFITSALASAAVSHVPLRCDKVPANRLLSALSTAQEGTVVILPGLRQPAADLGLGLHRFVTNGGGLVMFLGETVMAGRYESAFGDLLPIPLHRMEGEGDRPEDFWHIGEFDTGSPAFAAFRPGNSGDPTRPAFYRRFAMRGGVSGAVVARFADGALFMTMKQLGQGRIVLVNTSADTAWTDWPKRRTYVPWLQGVVALAAGRPAQAPASAAPELVCGAESRVAVNSLLPVRLRGPAGIAELPARAGVITLRADQPGVYTAERAPGQEFLGFTGSVPREESDLAGMTTEEFLQSVTRTGDTASFGSILALSGGNSWELWPLLLLAGLGLLVAESLLANRTWA